MGSSTENFCLRWNDFESNVSSSFREIRRDADFFDVTLTTSESGHRTLQAHKVILSACSNFFKEMLRQQTKVHSHPNPLIYLRGVTHNDLLAVLDFMYHGEVNVAQNDLNSFLSVAEELQIKGLTNKDQPEHSPNNKPNRSTPARSKGQEPPTKRFRKSSPFQPSHKTTQSIVPTTSTIVDDDDDDIKEVVSIKMDPEVPITVDPENTGNPDEESYDDSYGDYFDNESGQLEGDGNEDNSVVGDSSEGAKGSDSNYMGVARLANGQSGQCMACGKIFSSFSSCKRHFALVHKDNEKVFCHICGSVFKNSETQKAHLRRNHNIYQSVAKSAIPQ